MRGATHCVSESVKIIDIRVEYTPTLLLLLLLSFAVAVFQVLLASSLKSP